MIDWKRTKEKTGYNETYFNNNLKSNKKVYRYCNKCNMGEWIEFLNSYKLCKFCLINEQNIIKSVNRSEERRIRQSCTYQGIDRKNFTGFITNQKYCSKFNNECREKNRKKYDNQCFVCGKNELENFTKSGKQRKLSVHHIDMNKDQGCNDNEWALVPVCLNCHRILHTKLWQSRIEYLLK